MNSELSLFGQKSESLLHKIDVAHRFLKEKSSAELLKYVGQTIELPKVSDFDNSFIQKSSRKSEDHFLTGSGLFFITECGQVVLDCTAGHYQMPWGYSSENIDNAVIKALQQCIKE